VTNGIVVAVDGSPHEKANHEVTNLPCAPDGPERDGLPAHHRLRSRRGWQSWVPHPVFIEDLARAVRNGDWVAAHSIADQLAVAVAA